MCIWKDKDTKDEKVLLKKQLNVRFQTQIFMIIDVCRRIQINLNDGKENFYIFNQIIR